MKKLLGVLLSITLVTITATDSLAQLKYKPGIKFGYTIGNMAMDPDPAEAVGGSHSMTGGFMFGLTFDIPSKRDNVKYVPEIYLMTSGDKFEHVVSSVERETKFTSTYLVVPIMIKYFFKPDKFKPFFSLGPEISFLFKAKQDPQPTSNFSSNVREFFKKANFAVAFSGGFEYEIPNNPLALVTEIRYAYGVQNIGNHNPSLVGDPKIKTKILTLSIGVRFK